MNCLLIEGPSTDEFVNLALESLTERQRLSLVYRFGIGGHKPMTYEEIGHEFGVSGKRARGLTLKALRRLRHPSNAKLLRVSFEAFITRDQRPAICRNRPPEWCMNKYHGAKDFE